jgi:hypothetical protein
MNCDRVHGRFLMSHYLVATFFPCTPTVRLDAHSVLVLLYSYLHYIYDVMLVSERRNEIRHEVPIT